ncbi:MAG TPA: HEPN domain-containing protein [Gaiellaceae bacterium]|nr:HEPN domain-containing protein [Gaiellaceae bacterium]
MSPRSAEFFEEARSRLATAARVLADDPSAAVSLAYYAMLYAARAALSEEDRYATTHRGVWDLFWQTFPAEGKFDSELAEKVRDTQRLRQLSDYEAKRPSMNEAERVVGLAARFLDAVADLIDG